MASFETTIKFEIYCHCGTPLEQIPGERCVNFVTVRPCPTCTQASRLDAELAKDRLMEVASVGQINRRGTWVDERST